MCLSDRVKASFAVLFAGVILTVISPASPGLGQAPPETPAHGRQPAARHAPGHRHVRGSMIVCNTSDVHACHREFKRRHGGQAAHHE